MSLPLSVTTGEQSVGATGAITGTLTTTGLPLSGILKCRIRGLAPGQSVRVDIEDTASVTPFSDAKHVCTFDTNQGEQVPALPEIEASYEMELFNLPDLRFGAVNNQLRGNCTAISASTTALIYIWLEQ